jgi:hypothetical protein
VITCGGAFGHNAATATAMSTTSAASPSQIRFAAQEIRLICTPRVHL